MPGYFKEEQIVKALLENPHPHLLEF